MIEAAVEHDLTLWMQDDIPIRLFYAGRRWRVTDTPTRLRDSIWTTPDRPRHGLYGWRFQATDEAGETFMFDVYRDEDGWHVHHMYE
ncbi:MAG: hypothetical protein CMH82_14895 [Nocardioides sp.]|nr:hypothetical protein [Nocardioides sp.]|tara:strand:- start:138 stop:398 length:261 start_codon:yes stop_codon:yes gene_type:complete